MDEVESSQRHFLRGSGEKVEEVERRTRPLGRTQAQAREAPKRSAVARSVQRQGMSSKGRPHLSAAQGLRKEKGLRERGKERAGRIGRRDREEREAAQDAEEDMPRDEKHNLGLKRPKAKKGMFNYFFQFN